MSDRLSVAGSLAGRAAVAGPFVVAALTLAFSAAQAQTAPHIEWEIYNRLRFYKNAEIFRKYLEVAKQAGQTDPANWVLNTENLLQEAADKAGWAANNLGRDDLCWDRSTLSYEGCGSPADYVAPKAIGILARIAGAETLEAATCSWTLDAPPGSGNSLTGPCSGTKIDVPYAPDGSETHSLAVTVEPGAVGAAASIAPETLRIRDYLIVGMGDSFGAGVGNPDIPVRMASDGSDSVSFGTYAFPKDSERTFLPVREGLAGSRDGGPAQAQWLDIRCFRSQYGPQFRAALHLAAAMPHASVTFLDFSCDGATVLQGLLRDKPLGEGFAPNIRLVRPQIAEVANLVCDHWTTDYQRKIEYQSFGADDCKQSDRICDYQQALFEAKLPSGVSLKGCSKDASRRQIDYIMLSIGGNDIGFASLVAHEALRNDTVDSVGIRKH
jgi:hypothetical protein